MIVEYWHTTFFSSPHLEKSLTPPEVSTAMQAVTESTVIVIPSLLSKSSAVKFLIRVPELSRIQNH